MGNVSGKFLLLVYKQCPRRRQCWITIFEIKGEFHKMADAVRAVHSFGSQVAEETVFFREFCKTGKDFFIDILFHKAFLLSINDYFSGVALVPSFCT